MSTAKMPAKATLCSVIVTDLNDRRSAIFWIVNDPIHEFTEQALSYCALIEDNGTPNTWMFAQECLSQMLRLYLLALKLPEVVPEREELLESVEHDSWNKVRENVARRLSRDFYWAVFEPMELEQPEAVGGSLTDDLADVWRDLKPGLALLYGGDTRLVSEAVWQWRFSFETHWGQHAVSAIAALHALCYGQFADSSRPAREANQDQRRDEEGVSKTGPCSR